MSRFDPGRTHSDEGDGVHLDADRLTREQMRAVDAWLVANGCRHHVAIEPVVVKGRRAHYTAICRRDPKSLRRLPVHDGNLAPLGRRSVRIRVPLADYLTREGP